MIIQCDRCETAFDLEASRIKAEGSRVRCSQCSHVFTVWPPADPVPDEERFEDNATVAITDPLVRSRVTADPGRADAEPAPPATSLPPVVTETAKKKPRYTPFRRKLVYFAAALIGFIAVIVIPVEIVYRPLELLHQLISNGENLISGVEAAFTEEEMNRINRFGLATIAADDRERAALTAVPPLYYSLAFNMLLMEGALLPEEAVRNRLAYLDSFEGGFRYADLRTAAGYWADRFAADPGIRQILQKYKTLLLEAKRNAKAAGFTISEIYIMIDIGRKVGFFKEHIGYLLDSIDWWNISTYIGEPYRIAGNEFWRAAALEGREGFDHNPIDYWVFPRYDEDPWGLWYSVWLTEENDGVYDIFNIDFNAIRVKKLRRVITATVAGVIAILALMVFIITRWLAGRVTKPITELTRGAEAVAQGDYDYEVPVLKEDEFGELTRQFNAMTRGQKERLNLMETLKKFLSEDLAHRAAESGIVIGGQKADCTVMFTDFAGFSTITRNMTASESVNVLNAYFDGLVPIIKKYGGFPDKYIGDAIVALFGAPVPLEDHAERALACAIEMQWKMRAMNQERRRHGKTVFEMRIGLNSGEVLAGAIGCDQKLEYTSIGETTNLANRMEAISEIGHVMIAEGTYTKIKDTFFRGAHISVTPRQVTVKGYPHPVATYWVWVDNLVIEKDPGSGSAKSFYRYSEEDHDIKHHPDDVEDRQFSRFARFID